MDISEQKMLCICTIKTAHLPRSTERAGEQWSPDRASPGHLYPLKQAWSFQNAMLNGESAGDDAGFRRSMLWKASVTEGEGGI